MKRLLALSLTLVSSKSLATSWTIVVMDEFTKEERTFKPETTKEWYLPLNAFSGNKNVRCVFDGNPFSGKDTAQSIYCQFNGQTDIQMLHVSCTVPTLIRMYTEKRKHYGTVTIRCE